MARPHQTSSSHGWRLRPACDSEIEELFTSQRGRNLLAPLGSGISAALPPPPVSPCKGTTGCRYPSVGSPAVDSDRSEQPW